MPRRATTLVSSAGVIPAQETLGPEPVSRMVSGNFRHDAAYINSGLYDWPIDLAIQNVICGTRYLAYGHVFL
jgi:hypothetical protein